MTLYSADLGERVTGLIGEQVGGMVTGLYGIVQWIDDEGEQRIAVMTSPGQTFVVSQGLLTMANAIADTELTTYVMDSMGLDGDDD